MSNDKSYHADLSYSAMKSYHADDCCATMKSYHADDDKLASSTTHFLKCTCQRFPRYPQDTPMRNALWTNLVRVWTILLRLLTIW
eukprot:45697-Amorphochlora_amoeboformis.AAC.1